MPSTLAQYWAKLSPNLDELNIHPDDLRWFEQNRWNVQRQKPLRFSGYIRSKRFGAVDSELHLSLIPLPFVGNLNTAKIFLLLMNPGFSPSDYYSEEVRDFGGVCMRNLSQSNAEDEFPFFYLNPEFAWSQGFIWWEARLRPILGALMKSLPSYYEALATLAKQIATVELTPYHSVDGSALAGPGNAWKNLPSAVQAREFVKRLCDLDDPPLILVLRKQELWNLSAHNNCTCTVCPVLQRITLNPDLEGPNGDAGRAILKKLGIS